ncbi:MAG: DUF262 domain-containing protein [Candidatus Saccharimonas sp.]
MKINLQNIKVRDIINGYHDNGEAGVVGYGGKLDIRPAYQREFIYGDKERDAVLKTVRHGFPLNTMYWAKVGDDAYELMDGQQRTVSICQYATDIIPIKFGDGYELAFNNLTSDQQRQILDYELSIYICEGTDSEKLEWFKTINIAGKPLTEQELRNAVYTGPWLADAKRWFSKTGAPAAQIGENLVTGATLRQEILEKALSWISDSFNCTIEQYMATHQDDQNAGELWQYYQSVIDWVNRTFPNQDSARVKLMKGLDWGRFYNRHKDSILNAQDIENRIVELIQDDEVDSQKGIYAYLLTGDERTLNLRDFDDKTRQKRYQEQDGLCLVCGRHFEYGAMEADHITPWSQGGKTVYENCQMLCRDDNRRKSDR